MGVASSVGVVPPIAPPLPARPRGRRAVMAALEAGERCGQWGAAGPERGPGPGPGSLGSLLSRLPLAPPRRRTASQGQGPPEPPLLRTSKRTIYTAGRPPWYSETGAPVGEAFVIGAGRAGRGGGLRPGSGDGGGSGGWEWDGGEVRGLGRGAGPGLGSGPGSSSASGAGI